MMYIRRLLPLLMVPLFFAPAVASAYSAQWIGTGTASTSPIAIANPTRAVGYFGKLNGEPQTFSLTVSQPIRLYVSVLQPNIEGVKKDVSVAILDPKHPDIPLGVILGPAAQWTEVSYEGEPYLKGPDFRSTLPSGTYMIAVWSSNNDAPYVLVVGENEAPFYSRISSAISALPQIERNFYGNTGAAALRAPVILWPLVILIIILIVLIVAWRRRSVTV